MTRVRGGALSTGVHVRRIRVDGAPLVAKSARGGARVHLRREAELLGHLEGLPVVALVALRDSDDRTDLVTRDAGDLDLASPSGLSPTALLGGVASAAAAVAQLHRGGWSHGALCCEHVVVDADGRATLCSLGSARPVAATTRGADEDLEQLRTVIDRVARHRDPGWSPDERRWWRRRTRRLSRSLVSADRAARDQGRSVADAATVAALLRELVDHRAPRPAVTSAPRLGRAPTTLLVGIVSIGVTALWWAGRAPAIAGGVAGDASEPTPVAARCADVEAPRRVDVDGDGCAEQVSVRGNELRAGATTFRAGTDGDRAAIVARACDERPTVVLLRPSTGDVFRFDRWPVPGRPSTAGHVATVPGAIDLRVDNDCASGSRSMIRLVARRADGSISEVLLPPPTSTDPEDGP